MEVHAAADDLGEVIGPGCTRCVPLALDVLSGEPHELAVGEDALTGFVNCQTEGRRRGGAWRGWDQDSLRLRDRRIRPERNESCGD